MSQSVPQPNASDRRAALRKACSFDLQFRHKSGTAAGIGLEISDQGVVFMAPLAPEGSFQAVAVIRGHTVALTLGVLRVDELPYQGTTWNKLACAVETAPQPQWHALVDGTPGGIRAQTPHPPLPVRAAAAAPVRTAAAPPPDGLDRLPPNVQRAVIAQLIALKRLDAPRHGHAPLLKIAAGQALRDRSGAAVRRYHVHSKHHVHGVLRTFETVLLISDRGVVKVER